VCVCVECERHSIFLAPDTVDGGVWRCGCESITMCRNALLQLLVRNLIQQFVNLRKQQTQITHHQHHQHLRKKKNSLAILEGSQKTKQNKTKQKHKDNAEK
jgi:hypothetical protein